MKEQNRKGSKSGSKIGRPVAVVDTRNQLSLLLTQPGEEDAGCEESRADRLGGWPPRVRFREPDPKAIRINEVRLDEYLRRMGQSTPLRVRAVLSEVSFELFEQAYRGGGRSAYAPSAMVGVILCGIMQGVTSLRDLERFARLDLGCLWVSGGIAPDHSIIGRFIQRHEGLLSEEFFKELTGRILGVSGSDTSVLAGDGTVIEAAASRYGTMRAEALKAAREEQEAAVVKAQAAAIEARAQSEQACAGALERTLEREEKRRERLRQADEQLEQRRAVRLSKGKDPKGLSVQPQEPEAVVQKQKDKKNFRASYKPSVLANEARVIVACEVHASSETAVIPGMLEQAESQGELETLMLDAGYFAEGVIEASEQHDIELLCPQGRSQGEDWNKHWPKSFPKSRFHYNAEADHYRCPGDQVLERIGTYRGNAQNPGYTLYGTGACGSCPLKSQCTRSETGRRIKRYAIDARKDALREQMTQPDNRTRYRRRQALVEPVFGHLRTRQGLNRFRRKGLKGVRVEFALHALAYNLSRAVVALAGACARRSWALIIALRRWVMILPLSIPTFQNATG